MLVNLRTLRHEANISQKQLADRIGVSQQSINKYENHNIEPDIATLIRIANYFQISVDYLIGNTSIRRKAEVVEEYALNHDESEVIKAYRKLSQKQKESVHTVINSYND